MNFVVVTHVVHKKVGAGYYAAYGPYVKEMNLWFRHCERVTIVAPISDQEPDKIDLPYAFKVRLVGVHEIDLTTSVSLLSSLFFLPATLITLIRCFRQADHIHLRCPGNMGLLGCIVQIFFRRKRKSAKYAGNWDKNSQQPFTYRLQRRILNSEVMTKNIKVMVYGNWPDSSPRNTVPFFTASYSEDQKIRMAPRVLAKVNEIRLIFTGALIEIKRPILAIKVAEQLRASGYTVRLDIFGDGPLKKVIQEYISQHDLDGDVHIHGNQPAATIIEYFRTAHFLVFLSKTEGWPKVVAEAMWWGCLPITTAVSCVPEMVGDGKRGSIIPAEPVAASQQIQYYVSHPDEYNRQALAASEWAQQFTLEKFEQAIVGLLSYD